MTNEFGWPSAILRSTVVALFVLILWAGAAWAAPVITGISPDHGDYSATTPVTITGTGFTGATSVNFSYFPMSSLVVVDDATITGVAPTSPNYSAGTVQVTVTTPSGTSAPFTFTYTHPKPTVTSISPSTGLAAGGYSVIINGYRVNTQGERVFFGANEATLTQGFGQDSFQATAPAGAVGSVHITVVTNGGTSTTSSADIFTYLGAPTVTSLSPATGSPAGGASVTINGAGLTGVTAVSFGGTPAASFAINGDGRITAISPAGADGTVDVTVTNSYGTSPANAGDRYTYAVVADTSGAETAQVMSAFFDAQGHLILANMPDAGRRIRRLNGITTTTDPIGALMGYLPVLANGQLPPTLTASTAAIAAMTGQPKSRFDAWFQSTLGLFEQSGTSGAFGVASAGADYLVNDGLLVGGFIEADTTPGARNAAGDEIGGIGWLAGPYATVRLSDNLYLDILAGAGTSHDHVSLGGGAADTFDTVRWMANTALIGAFEMGNWTISPTARFSYFQENAKAHSTGAGASVAAVSTGIGQLAVGPGVSYRFDMGDGSFARPGVRFDGLVDLSGANGKLGLVDPRGRVEGTLDLGSEGGASFSLSGSYSGIGTRAHSESASLSLAVPMH